MVFTRPGRDAQATTVEEVFAEARATDDYGIRSLELVYRVNGGEEKTVSLYGGGGKRMPEVIAGHTFFLEELGLAPGDVIAYFARATDNGAGRGTHLGVGHLLPPDPPVRQGLPRGRSRAACRASRATRPKDSRRASARSSRAPTRSSATGPSRARRRQREDLAILALSQGRLRERVQELVQQMVRAKRGADGLHLRGHPEGADRRRSRR